MNDILRDPSPDKLISAIEGNLSAWIPIFGQLGQSYIDHPPCSKRSITDLPISLFNSVMDAKFAPDQIDSAIEIVLLDARAHHVPVLWWIGPSTQPADLGKHLEKHGFLFDENSPGMAADLEKLNEDLPKPEGLSIRLAQDDTAWRQWTRTMDMGFGSTSPNEPGVNAWCSMIRQAGPEVMQAYVGWLDDKPIASSLLFMAAGVAGIYCVATVPEARRKGIGAMLSLYPLLQARAKGYKFGILQSSEMGLSVYRSLGFQTYCNINSYFWKPE